MTRAAFMAVKTYLDGSQSHRFLTLGGVVADSSIWDSISDRWKAALGDAPYMHMEAAMSLTGPFENWSTANRDALVRRLFFILREHSNQARIHALTCTVDLVSHRKWCDRKEHPAPARICARLVFPNAVDWCASLPDPIMDMMELIFDRDEPFMRHIRPDWENKKFRKEHPMMEVVRSITSASMVLTPALQVADMIAWSRNRLANSATGDAVASNVANAINGYHIPIGESVLSRSRFRPEGFQPTQALKLGTDAELLRRIGRYFDKRPLI